MTMYDILNTKRLGNRLSPRQISYFVQGFTNGDIPDYQASALLMAICLQGMTDEETAVLTAEMAKSGDQMDLSSLGGIPVDKHSTGGVGDKTTLIVAPAAAACGATVFKMSGRGLGHTGGTLDKLEAIPGCRIELTAQQALEQTKQIGLCVIGQSGRLAPADKKLYALRDVTATVQSIPLIASSIMSKKLAAGCGGIVLDVKVGSGAFMKTRPQAEELARQMMRIGVLAKRRVAAVLSDMDRPLGSAVGNAVEVAEAIEVLNGKGPQDLRDLCVMLGGAMLHLSSGEELQSARARIAAALDNGTALEKLRLMVQAQGGDGACILHPEQLPQAAFRHTVTAPQNGFVSAMDTERIGLAAMSLGAGRKTYTDRIDPAAGLLLHKKTGDAVCVGEPICTLLTNRPEQIAAAQEQILTAYRFADTPPAPATPPILLT